MKPYGMPKIDARDTDACGCSDNGRRTGIYNIPGPGGKPRAYRALRGGKKARVRRIHKRRARIEGKEACRVW